MSINKFWAAIIALLLIGTIFRVTTESYKEKIDELEYENGHLEDYLTDANRKLDDYDYVVDELAYYKDRVSELEYENHELQESLDAANKNVERLQRLYDQEQAANKLLFDYYSKK